jgi:hypothetical protein
LTRTTDEAMPAMKETRNARDIPKYVIAENDCESECLSEIGNGEVVYGGPMKLEDDPESDKFMLMLQQILDDVVDDDNCDVKDTQSQSDQILLNLDQAQSTMSTNDLMETLGYPSDELTGPN